MRLTITELHRGKNHQLLSINAQMLGYLFGELKRLLLCAIGIENKFEFVVTHHNEEEINFV